MSNRLALYPCPADMKAGEDVDGERTCGHNFPSKNGAVMHAVNVDDDHHNQVENKVDAGEHLLELSVDVTGTTFRETPSPTTDGGGAGVVRDPEIPPADDDGGTDQGSTENQTESCPNCDADLEMSEEEVREFIGEHGEAYCPTCGFEVTVDD